MYSDTIDNSQDGHDEGAHIVSDKVHLRGLNLGAYVLGGRFTHPDKTGIFALADGTACIVTQSGFENDDVERVALSDACIVAGADADASSLLIGLADGSLVSLHADGKLTTIVADRPSWIEQVSSHAVSGSRAYSCGRSVYVVNADNQEFAMFKDHPSSPTGLSFSPEGNQLAVSHYGGVTIWGLDTGDRVQTLEWNGSHTNVSWSPDGQYVASAMQDKELHCWRVDTGKSMRMSGYPSKIRALSWTKEGNYLCVSGADVVTSWDFNDGGPSGKPPLELGYVYNAPTTLVAAHPNELWVAAGFNEGTVLIGHILEGNSIIARPPGGGAISFMSWSNDGRHLLVGTADGEVSEIQPNQ